MAFIMILLGILTSLFLSTTGGVQTKAKDTERQTDIKALHGQVEAYYAQNGRYPTLANMNDATFRAANMKGLDEEALKDPEGEKAMLGAAAATNTYAYAVTGSDGSACDNSERDCATYTLTATLDDGKTFTKNNLN